MDRFHEIEVFIAVADAGSFAKAGARLRLSPPAVTRAIASLEERLGAAVFTRTTRSLSITDVGTHFLESARRVLADLDGAEKEAVGQGTTPQGHLTITASVTFGRSALAPIVAEFLRRHPRITVSTLLLDRVTNLVEEGIDLAVRIGPLPDSTLVARRVGSVQRVLVASPDYLARRGVPTQPADLRLHAMIAFTGLMPNREWRFLDGKSGNSVSFMPRLEINDAVTAIRMAEDGDGITVALSYMVADQLRSGRLALVLTEMTPPPVPVHLVYPQNRIIAPKLRAFIDFTAPRLAAEIERLSLPGPAASGQSAPGQFSQE